MKFKSAHFFFRFITFQKIVKLEPFIVFEHDFHLPQLITLKNYPVAR